MEIESFLRICGEVYKKKTPSLRWGQTISLVFSRHITIPETIDPYYDDEKTKEFLDYILEVEQ